MLIGTPDCVTNLSQKRDLSNQRIIIRLLTYNVFLRPPGINNNGNDFKNERCELIIDEMDRFDIICFQELFGLLNKRKMRIQNKAFKKGLIYQATSPSPSFLSGSIVDGGLVTLSRYPILMSKFQQFPYGVLSDNLSLKGVLYTKIEINGNILHLFNTHFQASYVGREDNIRATLVTRIDQMKCYRKFMTKMLSENSSNLDDLVLLMGDFNVDALHLGYPSAVFNQFPKIQDSLHMSPNDIYYEYNTMMNILSHYDNDKIIDHLRAKFENCSVATYGDINKDQSGITSASETILTDSDDWQSNQCLDYIMQFVQSHSLIQEPKLIVKTDSLRVEKFLIQNQKVTQLSDHYGVSCELHLKTG